MTQDTEESIALSPAPESGDPAREHRVSDAAALERTRGAELHVHSVGKVFESARGSVQALRDINFVVDGGSFAALVGPSGCGKSTMLRIVSGIYPATTGSVLVGGDPVIGPREDVGLIFQSPNLLPWRNIERNVSLPLELGKRATKDKKREARSRADAFLSMVGLLEFKDKLPHELSGGMQQRAGIVRALVQDPTILLMDEPFGAVDVLTREKLNFEIQSLWEQTRKTIVFVTHSIQEAVFLADVIFVFSPRPGTIIQTVKIELARPRERATIHTPEFFEYEELVRAHVKEAV
jgi:NitT/TauT family transport system ATP-binding protein